MRVWKGECDIIIKCKLNDELGKVAKCMDLHLSHLLDKYLLPLRFAEKVSLSSLWQYK